MKKIILLILTPIFYVLLYRQIIPLHWYFNTEVQVDNQYQLLFNLHVLYLVYQITLSLIIMLYVYFNIMNKQPINEQITINKKVSFKLLLFALLGLVILGNDIPVLSGFSSENIVRSSSENKIITFLGFGLLTSVSTFALIAFTYRWDIRRKTLILIAALPTFLASKKSGFIVFVQDCVLLLILSRYSFSTNFILRILCYLLLSVLFGLFILSNMVQLDIKKILDIYYATSTSYLNVFWQDYGIRLEHAYRKEIGEIPAFQYLANPFLKILGIGGIEYSIGPYLSSKLNGVGDGKVLTGVNPTLFFELVFIFGQALGVFMSFLLITLINLFIIKIFNILSKAQYSEIIVLCVYWEGYKFLNSVQFDIVNSYKSSLISIICFILLHYLLKIRLKW